MPESEKEERSVRSPLRGTDAKRGGQWRLAVLRLGVWCLVVLVLVAGVRLGWGALRRAFFTRNPHFTLQHVQVEVNGQLRPAEIAGRLARLKVRAGEKNLFELDLPALRADLRKYVMVADARLRLQLPDTLRVEVDERVPVAQYQARGGRLVDPDGWVMPPRIDPKLQAMPLILGVRNDRQQRTGAKCNDEMVLGALHFLHLKGIRPYGQHFDVDVIQLDYEHSVLRLHLHARGTLREHAQLLVPAKPLEMDEALQRVDAILVDRIRAQQNTGFIDATYRVNIPVLP